LIDLATKSLAIKYLETSDKKIFGNFFKFALTFNKGAAFSLATSKTIFLSSFAIAVAATILWIGRRINNSKWATALGIVLGGIFGNLADRIFRTPGGLQGAVVDWIKVSKWPTFNIADASVVIGAVIILYLRWKKIPLRNGR
jgi:signal peptidase II